MSGHCTDAEHFCLIEKGAGPSPRLLNSRQAKAAIFEYIEIFDNRQRRHSGIGYQTPQQAFESMTRKMAA
jgi:putative transposase